MLYLLNIIIYHSYVAYVALAEGLLAFGAQPQFAQMDSHLYIISQTFQTKGRVGPKRAAMGRLTQWDLSGSIAFFFSLQPSNFLGGNLFDDFSPIPNITTSRRTSAKKMAIDEKVRDEAVSSFAVTFSSHFLGWRIKTSDFTIWEWADCADRGLCTDVKNMRLVRVWSICDEISKEDNQRRSAKSYMLKMVGGSQVHQCVVHPSLFLNGRL